MSHGALHGAERSSLDRMHGPLAAQLKCLREPWLEGGEGDHAEAGQGPLHALNVARTDGRNPVRMQEIPLPRIPLRWFQTTAKLGEMRSQLQSLL